MRRASEAVFSSTEDKSEPDNLTDSQTSVERPILSQRCQSLKLSLGSRAKAALLNGAGFSDNKKSPQDNLRDGTYDMNFGFGDQLSNQTNVSKSRGSSLTDEWVDVEIRLEAFF